METINDNPDLLLTVSEVARELKVSAPTVRKYEIRKLLPATRLANGTRLFHIKDVQAFKEARGK
jgi:excisionase family DNA binding protein